MARELAVWLFADRVGTLATIEGRLQFHYLADWLSRPNAVALSRSLPLQSGPFDDRQARPFFAGLLPEGHLRRLIAKQLQVSGQNEWEGRPPQLVVPPGGTWSVIDGHAIACDANGQLVEPS